jgi:hypothetical protein
MDAITAGWRATGVDGGDDSEVETAFVPEGTLAVRATGDHLSSPQRYSAAQWSRLRAAALSGQFARG